MKTGGIMNEEIKANTSISEKADVLNVRLSTLIYIPTIMQSILKHLPARDLYTCTYLDRSWKEECNYIRKQRCCITVIQMKKYNYYYNDKIPIANKRLQNKLLNQMTITNLALVSCSPRNRVELEKVICNSIKENLHRTHYDVAPIEKLLKYLLKIVQKCNKKLKNYYPATCGLMHIPYGFCDRKLGRRAYYGIREFAYREMVLNFPITKEIEVQPFVIRDQYILDALKINFNIDELYLSNVNFTLKTSVKVVIAFIKEFADIQELETVILPNTTIGKFLNTETVIVGLYRCNQLFSTGVALSGKNVHVKGIFLVRDICCARRYDALWKKTEFIKDRGMVFFFGHYDDEGTNLLRDTLEIWVEHFPDIKPIVLETFHFIYQKYKIIDSLGRCDGVCRLLNCNEPDPYEILILYIEFDSSTVQFIRA